MDGELYRPLGLDLEARDLKSRTNHWAWSLPVLAGTGLLAGSFALAVLQPSFAPPPADPLSTSAPIAERAQPIRSEPEIVRSTAAGVTITTGNDAPTIDGSAPAMSGAIRVLEPGSLRQKSQFAHIPDPALIEESGFGPLPIRAADGRRPLDVYAGASSGALGTRIAIIVGGLGISQTGTQHAVETLPAGVTLAFAAAGNSLDRWMQNARRSGHELLLQASMEPFGYPDVSPGEHTLRVADAAAGQFDDLFWSLGRMTNYVGVMNFMGARLTADRAGMDPLLSELGRRGLLYVDDGTSARSVARDVASTSASPFAAADMLLDEDRDPGSIQKKLASLEQVARAKGTAIGVASAFDASVETIANWIDEAQGRGIEIVPVSALAFDPEAR